MVLPTPRRTFSLLAVLLVGHVLIISAQVQSQSGVPVLEATAFGLFARIQRGLSAVSDAGGNLWTHYFALSGAARENDDLKRQVVELQGSVQALEARLSQQQALEDTLALRDSLAVPSVAARVIAGSPDPGSLNVMIDRGSLDGVTADMPVIAASGVVGRVIGTPAPRAAYVQLLVGKGAAAGARLESTGAGGIATGGWSQSSLLRLEYVSHQVEVKTGDRVLTSGQDRIYPQGFLIGFIERADPPGAKREIYVRPAVDFSHVAMVLVLLTSPSGESRPE
jgi:rod shape-determining protein MreC